MPDTAYTDDPSRRQASGDQQTIQPIGPQVPATPPSDEQRIQPIGPQVPARGAMTPPMQQALTRLAQHLWQNRARLRQQPVMGGGDLLQRIRGANPQWMDRQPGLAGFLADLAPTHPFAQFLTRLREGGWS
jgi:hypothetical protein